MKKKLDKTEHKSSRRNFLKKVAWSTPALIVLGQIVSPTSLKADSTIDGPPNDGWM